MKVNDVLVESLAVCSSGPPFGEEVHAWNVCTPRDVEIIGRVTSSDARVARLPDQIYASVLPASI